MIDATAIQRLKQQFRGDLIQPGHPDYDDARRVYNAMIDRKPALIARCTDVADVMSAVHFARGQDLPLAVRGGGHSGPGLAVCDNGIVADLSPMKGIRVDPEARIAQVEPGCDWGDVDHATHAFGLATVSGMISSTGVPGLALGGGHGYLSRKYGLTVDNLVGADVVLADGRFVHASDDEHPDLFWALRGGGGNFGVVTSFAFRLHPVDTVYAGPSFWSLEEADEVLRWYRDFLPQAPESLYGFFAFMTVPPSAPFPERLHGRSVCSIMWCYCGALDEAETALGPLRAFRPPLFEHIGPVPYPALQSMFDGFYPPGLQWYWKGDFVREIPDEAVAKHLEHAKAMPTPLSTLHLYPIDGAVHRVDSAETAFGFRDANWSAAILGVSDDPADSGRIRDWARDYWDDLHPYSAGGGYVNFMDQEEGESRVRAAYGGNYERLVEIKTKYDPDNVFHLNQNIPPLKH